MNCVVVTLKVAPCGASAGCQVLLTKQPSALRTLVIEWTAMAVQDITTVCEIVLPLSCLHGVTVEWHTVHFTIFCKMGEPHYKACSPTSWWGGALFRHCSSTIF
jgi:hypothetical protein